jgi:hypothetical protein
MSNDIAVEPLIADDLRIIETMRKTLGDRAANQTRTIILRERAKQIVPVTEEQIERSLAYLRHDPGTKPTGGFWVLARKFITEDEKIVKRFEGYCQALLENGAAPSFVCETCRPPTRWGSIGSLAVHKSKRHGIPGTSRETKRRARNKRKRK